MRWLSWFCCAALAWAQGSDPKPKAEEYELHGKTGHVSVGAEFMVHSFSGQGQTFIVKDYLVVEVALYPEKGTSVHADPAAFSLRVNGKQRTLPSQPATAVVTSLQRPEWRGGPRLEGTAGAGGVILGTPRGGGQQAPPWPSPPRAPDSNQTPGVDPPERIDPNDLLVRTALPAGDYKGPVSGFLYFPYRGKMSAVKSIDLLYEDIVLKLR